MPAASDVSAPAVRLRSELPRAAAATARASVCIVTQNDDTSFGGMEVHTLGLMDAFIEAGYAVELVVNRYGRYDDIVKRRGWTDAVRLVHTDCDGILYGERSNRRGWRKVFAGLSSRTVIFTKGNNNFGQIGFLKECRRAFAKVLFIEHLEPRERPARALQPRRGLRGFGLWWYKRKLLSNLGSRYADHVVAVSQRVRDRLVTDIGYPASKVEVIRNGVPAHDFVRSHEQGVAARARHGIAPNALVFGMLTRLSPEKGIDTALQAFRLLADQPAERRPHLVIAGEGHEAANLHALTERLHLEDRVTFLGFVGRPEEILSAYDVILFSSRVEGLPLGLLQGMAAGCIPIVTRISGMPEAVSSPDIGWIVRPDDPADLCAAFRSVLAMDDSAVVRMRRSASQMVREHFDVSDANRRFLELCDPGAAHENDIGP